LESLPESFNNFTIAQISDLHVGPTIKRPYVEDVLEKISRLNPDLIAVTGDLVDGSVKYLKSELQPLKDMIAPYGTFFVTGNHEYYSGVDLWLDETDRLGMKNLINSNELISRSGDQIAIAGITDLKAHQIKPAHRSDPGLALRSVPDNITKIVLAHQPNSIHSVHEIGADLQLSGHTHGGQFWPFTYLTKLVNPYIAGFYDHYGTQIYVNRGTGYWGPPLRIGVPAEITLIRLKKKEVL
jgi:predicted MPP superfamily phosphohydrolase